MAVRASFENNCEIGCFAKLTNTYCLVAIGGSENFYRCGGSPGAYGGGEACAGVKSSGSGRVPAPLPRHHRVHVPTVCSRASSPIPSPWCTRLSPAAASSGACVWGTGTVSWYPTIPPTRSCNTFATASQTQCRLGGWRSGSQPWAMSPPAMTTWPWSTQTWTGRQKKFWQMCSRWKSSDRQWPTRC
ncbi:EIF6 isoform 7 [Pan troglodytes]|uniref:Eukaryotic translation initiation factor 6 n=2 Tax=Homininae TaxID=207598 RepID=F8WDS6_HUMAN|nr:eukaryotic translation initiation factor 6 [Homo sapiens]KAI4005286.1 eukaryotic translation initiation factor 6 [Homo sapiens]PNI27865.1 EIF6 isoform 7 [Pan troglodytes]